MSPTEFFDFAGAVGERMLAELKGVVLDEGGNLWDSLNDNEKALAAKTVKHLARLQLKALMGNDIEPSMRHVRAQLQGLESIVANKVAKGLKNVWERSIGILKTALGALT